MARRRRRKPKKEPVLVETADGEGRALELFDVHPSDEALIQKRGKSEYGEMRGFQENGSRYGFERAKSGRSTCKGECKEKIAQDEIRFGSSNRNDRYPGSFLWRHVSCITGQQLANVAKTYGTDEYSVIPGWHLFSEEEKAAVAATFDELTAERNAHLINEYGEMCGFQENGSRYEFERAKSGRSTCQGVCKQNIAQDEIRFGSSKDIVFEGSFFWRHVSCVTGRQLANISKTYGTDEYSVVPGWHLFSEEEKAAVTARFDELTAERNAHFAKIERYETEPESWIDLDRFQDFTVAFLVSICRYAGLKPRGLKADIVRLLEAHREDGSAEVKLEKVDVKVEAKLEPTLEEAVSLQPRVTRKRAAMAKMEAVSRKKVKVEKKEKTAAVRKESPSKESQKLSRAERAARRAGLKDAAV